MLNSNSNGSYLEQKYLEILLQNKDSTSFHPLKYKLQKNQFTEKWFSLLHHRISNGYSILNNGDFFGARLDHMDNLVEMLKKQIEIINRHCEIRKMPELKIQLVPHLKMDRNFLASLHDLFEGYVHDRRFYKFPDIKEALRLLNITIHKCESFLPEINPMNVHIDLVVEPIEHVMFEEEDYAHFKYDLEFGKLYLAYGMTGQPTINAYYNQVTPRPQNLFSCGMFLCFYYDPKYEQKTLNEIKQWLWEKHQLDANNPNSAFGMLELGTLEFDKSKKEEIIVAIKNHQSIKSLNPIGNPNYDRNKLKLSIPDAASRFKLSKLKTLYHLLTKR